MTEKTWTVSREFTEALLHTVFNDEPLTLPDSELEQFGDSWLKWMRCYLVPSHGGVIANNPDAKFLWWTWLWLSPVQQSYLTDNDLDLDNTVKLSKMTFACFPSLMEEMQAEGAARNYWSLEKYAQLIHGVTKDNIIRLDPKATQEVFEKMFGVKLDGENYV